MVTIGIMTINEKTIDSIRNFCILAHIDHGKSTLADRFLEITGTIPAREMREQYLDMNPLERERGITIKMTPVRMNYEIRNPKSEIRNKSKILNSKFQNDFEFADSKQKFVLNLIDTPGHVDFSYEVSRALAAVEGAILLVDATQGVQAQTIANLRLAAAEGLYIIPAINKIDLPTARVKETREEIKELLSSEGISPVRSQMLKASADPIKSDRTSNGVEAGDIFEVSAKTGEGVEKLLQAVIKKVPPPRISNQLPVTCNFTILRALIFDSHFDPYKGVVAYVRVREGILRKGDKINFLVSGAEADALEIGYFIPHLSSQDTISAGDIGYIATGIKEPAKVKVGDTITNFQFPKSNFQIKNVEPLSGYKEPLPMVWASIYPEEADDFDELKDAMAKLKLNDAAFRHEVESSEALGRGFRCGFLGTLHLEIVSERLRREYNLRIMVTTPSVAYRIRYAAGKEEMIFRASSVPSEREKYTIEEPWATLAIVTPPEYIGKITEILHEHRAISGEAKNLGSRRIILNFLVPLAEIIVNLHDDLKSITQGYASMEYEMSGWRTGDLSRLNILVAGKDVAAFSRIISRDRAEREGRAVLLRLKDLMPRALFLVALQAEVEGRIIARETVPALKKDVTGYLYGGDRTRKMKLWKKQQKGKKKLKDRGEGAVEIPPEVFLKILKKG